MSLSSLGPLSLIVEPYCRCLVRTQRKVINCRSTWGEQRQCWKPSVCKVTSKEVKVCHRIRLGQRSPRGSSSFGVAVQQTGKHSQWTALRRCAWHFYFHDLRHCLKRRHKQIELLRHYWKWTHGFWLGIFMSKEI